MQALTLVAEAEFWNCIWAYYRLPQPLPQGLVLFLLVWEARPRGELAMTDAAMRLVGGELVLAQPQRRGK